MVVRSEKYVADGIAVIYGAKKSSHRVPSFAKFKSLSALKVLGFLSFMRLCGQLPLHEIAVVG